jgi:putative oxidoreductase
MIFFVFPDLLDDPDIGAITLLVVGILSVVVGYKARLGATALLAFLVSATFHGFTFWSIVNSQPRNDYIVYLVMNLSIIGS